MASTSESAKCTRVPTYECWRTIGKREHPDGTVEYDLKQRIDGVSHTNSEYSYMRCVGVQFNMDGTIDYNVRERIPN